MIRRLTETSLVLFLALGAAPAAFPATSALAQERITEAEPERLAKNVAAAIDELIASRPGPERIAAETAAIYDAAISAHGDVGLVTARLEELAAEGTPEDQRRVARRIAGLVHWRHGDLDAAQPHFAALAEDASDVAARLAHANVLDARGRTVDALAAYGALVEGGALDAALETRLRLRMALMSMETGGEEQKDALAVFARAEGRSIELRNRCAIVLALLGRPGDAADLYVVQEPLGAGAPVDERKASVKAAGVGELRVAEWALSAGDHARAQGAAWRAMQLATVARERRYALTLLAEAHRADGSLGTLSERFAEARETLLPEAREAWIDLLRETGATGAAIEMVQGDSAATFSKEERRRLLEMYREAGRTEEMIEVYRTWIAAEPDELVWRSGLARTYLEAGDRDAAIQVWDGWFDLPVAPERARALDVADALESLGLEDLAIRAAERAIEAGREAESAFLFLYDLERSRGRLEGAREALARLDAYADPGSPARMPLSDCLERLGELEAAVRVLEDVRAHRGPENAGEDLELRLAWLYSEAGREEDALALWRDIWTRIKSLPRRRFVEDRLMTVASRLGVLADVAVELERKLLDGQATEKDSGLLVRLYTKVGDAVSAAEIVDEFLRRSGGTELEALTEKARVYLACNDYYHYEKTVARLVDLDPEGRPDYYRQLAMSQLERGKPDQARATLMNLQALPGGDDGAEFEAGVLALSGLRDEAIASYRRGLAAHPERIDSYLLMANLLKEVRKSDLAVGMFQHLAETAERDDLFTIAIDGLLNMLVDAAPRPKMVQWARRVTLERLASEEDRPYLYQLLADLAEETGDLAGQVLALENSLASAGPRRASVLRELMELAKPAVRGLGTPARDGNRKQQLAFGRRLVGLGELVPPDVYLDLGEAFLEEGDEASAARTFDLTREFPDGELYQAQAAERFERAGAVERALDRYQAVLAASPTDVPLLAKVGEMTESLGDDGAAHGLYRRAYDLLLAQRTLYDGANKAAGDDERDFWFARNVDAFDQSIERVVQGLVATLADEDAVERFLRDEVATLWSELELARAAARAARAESADALAFASLPRLSSRAALVRRLAFASEHAGVAEEMDQRLLAEFPADDTLLQEALAARLRWGRLPAGRALVQASGAAPAAKERLLARLGGSAPPEGEGAPAAAKVPFDAGVAAVLPLYATGDAEALRSLVRRVDTVGVEKEQLGRMAVLFAGARSAEDPELVLGVGREWLRLDLQHKTPTYLLEERLSQILGALDAETGLALGRYFVSRVLEDPEANSTYVTLLPKLREELGEGVVDPEDVRTLLDGFGQRYAWGLGPVFALLPAAERPGALRGLWSKLEASNRADFLLGLVTDATEDVSGELADFVLEALPGALGDAEDFIEYSASELAEVQHSHELCVRVARIFIEQKPAMTFMPGVELLHRAALGETGLAPGAAEIWVELAGQETIEYPQRRVSDRLREVFEDEHLDAFLAAIDARLAGSTESPTLLRARVDLLLDAGRLGEARAALDAALGQRPDDAELMTRLRRILLQRGQRLEAARTLERLVAIAGKEGDDATKKRHLRTLVREWEALGAPELALAAKRELGGDVGPRTVGRSAVRAGVAIPLGAVVVLGSGLIVVGGEESAKGLPKSFDDVREALAAGDTQKAREVFRRLWRQFPEGQPIAPRFGGRLSYRNLALANLRWPADAAADAGEEDPDADPTISDARKGGLLAFGPNEPEPRPEPPDAFERLAEFPGIVAEERRFLRGVHSHELDRLQGLIEGLLAVDVANAGGGDGGREAVLAALLAKADAGDTGRADQIRLLATLSAAPERVTGAAAEALRGLVTTIPPRDAAQVMRLARVLHKSGDGELAARLYRWCALQGQGRTIFGGEEELDVVTSVSDQELVREARDHLEGDAQIELIQTVLTLADPGSRPWQQEQYERLVLDTWSEVVGPAAALERARGVAERSIDLSTGLRRAIALRAAPLFAAAGEFDSALRAVEVGLARLDPREVKQPEARWNRSDPTQEGRLGTDDLRRLFPVGGGPIPDAPEWTAKLAAAIEAWVQEGRFDADAAVRPLALAAQRLGEAGRTEDAAALVQRLAALDVEGADEELWIVDALREVAGDGAAAAARERDLLADVRLVAGRVPDVLERIRAEDGPKAALTAAEPVAGVMRQPALIDVLAGAAEALGETELAEEWRARGDAARAAEEALKSESETKSAKR